MVTLGFQTWIRLHQCAGVGPCAISLVKGAVWSAICTYWPEYFVGYRRPGYPATAAENDVAELRERYVPATMSRSSYWVDPDADATVWFKRVRFQSLRAILTGSILAAFHHKLSSVER